MSDQNRRTRLRRARIDQLRRLLSTAYAEEVAVLNANALFANARLRARAIASWQVELERLSLLHMKEMTK